MTELRKRPARILLATVLMSLLASSAWAADAVGWKLDGARSRLSFSGTQTGSKFDGQFARYTADIAFDPDHLEASRILVVVDLASANTGDKQRDAALPDKDWFDVAGFPQATFETTSIRRIDAKTYEAVGNLSLRGVTKSLTLPFALRIEGSTAHAVGHINLVRSEFGIGQGTWSTGKWVALDVGVDMDIVAAREN